MLKPSGKSAGFAVELPCHASPQGGHYDVSCFCIFEKLSCVSLCYRLGIRDLITLVALKSAPGWIL